MTIDLNETLKQGISAHQAGDLEAASAAYRQILKAVPDHADALHLSGLIAFQAGDYQQAIEQITRAISHDDKVPLYHANLGRVYKASGDDIAAVRAFRVAVQLEPDNALLQADLASALLGAGDADGARKHAGLALERSPALAEAHLNYGLAVQALNGAADQEALEAFHRALAINPELAGAYLGLGIALHEQGDGAGAAAAYHQALKRNPEFVEAHCNLGNLECDAMNFAGAVQHYQIALRLQADQPVVLGNLGVALQEAGRLKEAIDAYDKAVALDPEAPETRRNRAMALLAAGRFADGWADYEYRWQTPRFKRLARNWPVPVWDGRDLKDKRVLVHAEQGLGDTLQFCRYLPLISDMGATVTVECADSLKPLIETMPCVQAVIHPGDDLPTLDFHVPLMSLPGLFDTTLETIPASVPYVTAPAVAMDKWRAISASWPEGIRVGIAWCGSADHPRDAIRSPGLAPFLALAAVPGVALISLQKEGGTADIATLSGADKIIDPTAKIVDFGDTAALMRHLDIVVSCDSAPLHLAGALGVKTYAVLPHVAEWRWGTEGQRSPWYPSMTLMRQPNFGDWDTVFSQLVDILGQ